MVAKTKRAQEDIIVGRKSSVTGKGPLKPISEIIRNEERSSLSPHAVRPRAHLFSE